MTKLNLTSVRLHLGACRAVSGGRPEKDHYDGRVGSARRAELFGREAVVRFDVIFINMHLEPGINFSQSFNRSLPHWLSLGCKNEGNKQKLALKTVF